MPKPRNGESEKDFVARCIPIVMREGTAKDNKQASAICFSMYQNKDKKSMDALKFSKMMMSGMSGADYARQESWDCHQAAMALAFVCEMCMNEVNEPDDMNSLANIMRGLMEFMNGEIAEMVNAAKQGESYEGKSEKVPAQVKEIPDKLNLSYVKSLGIDIPENKLAVKYVGKNVIAHPVFIWGDSKKTDLEIEFFTRESDFWDLSLKDFVRPLTWEHGQDELFAKIETNPVIGKTMKYYDDDLARWAESVIEADKKYRKYLDQFIEEKRLGYSSDSAPQYVQRVKQGKAIWLKSWPWFGGSLTVAPCEPRMKVYTPEFLKSLGIAIPDISTEKWEAGKASLDYLRTKYLGEK
jgi:hypothetical protein